MTQEIAPALRHNNNRIKCTMNPNYKHANEILTTKSGNTLWLGDCSAAQDLTWLRQNNIRVVITAAAGFAIKYDPSIRHYRYELHDVKNENMSIYFDEAAQRMDKGLKWGSVLVHCGAGVSRSASLVIAYLIKYHNMGFMQALKFTRGKRPEDFSCSSKNMPCPSSEDFFKASSQTMTGFLNQSTYSNQSFPQISTAMNKTQNSNTSIAKPDSTQPKAWRISYHLKPQLASSSLDPRHETQDYIKKIAKFRFGEWNASKWGIY